MKKDVAETNQQVWFQTDIALEYARDQGPTPAEATILHDFSTYITQAALLDIGIGAGRTTGFLATACRQYTGIDYSQAMINLATTTFPEADLRQQDARNLSDFAEASFDMVWFSYNGIDYVSHNDRIKILREVRRVLKPQGLFIFSSHNRDSITYPAYHLKNLSFSINPVRFAKRFFHYVNGIINAAKLRGQEVHTNDYAILNDPAHQYNMLTYYISGEKQVEQLKAVGFEVLGMVGMEGKKLTGDANYNDGYSIYYASRAANSIE